MLRCKYRGSTLYIITINSYTCHLGKFLRTNSGYLNFPIKIKFFLRNLEVSWILLINEFHIKNFSKKHRQILCHIKSAFYNFGQSSLGLIFQSLKTLSINRVQIFYTTTLVYTTTLGMLFHISLWMIVFDWVVNVNVGVPFYINEKWANQKQSLKWKMEWHT